MRTERKRVIFMVSLFVAFFVVLMVADIIIDNSLVMRIATGTTSLIFWILFSLGNRKLDRERRYNLLNRVLRNPLLSEAEKEKIKKLLAENKISIYNLNSLFFASNKEQIEEILSAYSN